MVNPAMMPSSVGPGMGRPWPDDAVEVGPKDLETADVDVVIAQNPGEIPLAARWLGRLPGRDVPLVYVEHNTPGDAARR
ncbi:hypothetical protein [Prescottella agglutinans]|uniref:hypothetical protein n=1 Tax=Prescottella agglutinans TaxID=1644129 RepID=UPI003D96EA7C